MRKGSLLASFTKKTIDLFKSLGLYSVAWSLRRLYVPVSADAVVLEVGSGGNPFPRSDILVDAFGEETSERNWEPLSTERPTFEGFGEELPFRDKAFDYVIACHVLEHSIDPAKFLNELQRVAKEGYIELPNSLFERLCPYDDHRLEVKLQGETLNIYHKKASVQDPWFSSAIMGDFSKILNRLFRKNPYLFNVCLHWKSSISYNIVNEPETFKKKESSVRPKFFTLPFKARVKRFVLNSVNKATRKISRYQRKINLLELLRCRNCHSENFLSGSNDGVFICKQCGDKIKMVR